jgi:chromate transporter
MERAATASPGTSLAELAKLFLKLGTIGFGGPAAHIALMEDEVVHRRRWLTRDAFLDYVGATNLIPGPNSTELAIQIGRDRAGWPGLLVAGASFILPAAVIVTLVAWVYTRFGQLPNVAAVLSGVKAVVIAIVVQALWRLARTAIKSAWLAALGVASAVAAIAGVHELLVLLAATVVAAVGATIARGERQRQSGLLAVPGATTSGGALAWLLGGAGVAQAPVSLLPLFGVFLKIGSVIFGSGYVLLAFLRADLVERLGWLTEQQLLDAVAVGQITPGPVFTTATFIGYLLSGMPGATAATLGIFLPAFVFVAVSGPLVPRIRRSRIAGAALDGVNVASLALMAVVTWQLGRAAIVDVPTALLAIAAGSLLFTRRVGSAWLVAGGGVAGLLLWMARA